MVEWLYEGHLGGLFCEAGPSVCVCVCVCVCVGREQGLGTQID